MKKIEFYQDGCDVVYRMDGGERTVLKKGDRWLIEPIIERLKVFYPEAWTALCVEYKNLMDERWNFEFRVVSRFIKCNFGLIDPVPDIDELGDFHFEHVDCPLHGECRNEGVICRPVFNSELSEREKQVMKMLTVCRASVEQTAEALCISPHTVAQHRKNVYRKVKVNSEADFILWAVRNGVFDS